MIFLVYPHQLFQAIFEIQPRPTRVVLIEDSLFFGDAHYPARFHKQKLWLHRATMKRFECVLRERGFETEYLEYDPEANAQCRHLRQVATLMKSSPKRLDLFEPTDFILEKRLKRFCEKLGIRYRYHPTPQFMNTSAENRAYRDGKKRWFMADFYKHQRRRFHLLMEDDQPVGGKWSYDENNRKKVPKNRLDTIPPLVELKRDDFDHEAVEYVERRFAQHPGELKNLFYPTSHADAESWLDQFLEYRLNDFGPFEDAIVENESWLWHSVLTPALNIGLLTPEQVVRQTLDFAAKQEVPIHSLEGFLRQVIGWREFVRATYEDIGVKMRTSNHWKHERKIPDTFYSGQTGILPVDNTIQRVLETGYCHHIERLMVLGGFMFLCEFEPDEIYRWFMELFVDSYDWVMVPNVYSMSQHACGGLITTKPYFSGSSYIRKMSHYPKASWCDTWDGLYWRWIWLHREELGSHPRWAMMCRMAERMDSSKREQHLLNAESFLKTLDKIC